MNRLAGHACRIAVTWRALLTVIIAAGVIALMAGCGGGGSGTSSTGSNAQYLQGTVAAPGGALTASVKSANGIAESTTTETGVSGLTVAVGTLTSSGTSGSATFNADSSATATSASDGTFTITIPAGTSITGNTVIIAYSGTAPTTLPAAGVLVSPVIEGKQLVDPVTTAATTYLCQQAAGNGVPLANLNQTQVASYLGAAEGAASNAPIPAGCPLPQMEQIITTSISGSASTGITLTGIIVAGAPNSRPQGPNGTLTSGAVFLTGADTNGASFNGTSTEFTATNAGLAPNDGNIAIAGTEAATSTTPQRTFQILIPSSGHLAAGTYTATVTYSESTVPATTSSVTPPVPTNAPGYGPGNQFCAGVTISLWSASSVTVTVTAGASSSAPFNIAVSSATYSPQPGPDGKTVATGTLTTALTGTAGQPG